MPLDGANLEKVGETERLKTGDWRPRTGDRRLEPGLVRKLLADLDV
jgi:hypothetical protein